MTVQNTFTKLKAVEEFGLQMHIQQLRNGGGQEGWTWLEKKLPEVNLTFLQNSEKVVSGEISLKDLIEENMLIIEVRKVGSVLSQITGYQSVEKLSRKYPGKFDFEALTAYVGAEVKDGKLNQKAIELERHYQNVKRFPLKSIPNPVKFIEISSCDELLASNIGDSFDTIILQMREANQDLCMSIIKSVLGSRDE